MIAKESIINLFFLKRSFNQKKGKSFLNTIAYHCSFLKQEEERFLGFFFVSEEEK